MKVITEMSLRGELKGEHPEVYYVPKDKLLSPAAKEYLNQLKIKVEFGDPPPAPVAKSSSDRSQEMIDVGTAKYVDDLTGAYYVKKPEYMTQLHGNRLVYKNHPRIVFRGKLDSLGAQIILMQAEMAESGAPQKLIDDLGDVFKALNQIMYCEVMDVELQELTIIGLTE